MRHPPKRATLVKSLLTGKEHLRKGIVLEPSAETPLDRVWVHWPGDGETVWAEKIADLAHEYPEVKVQISPPEPTVRFIPVLMESPMQERGF